MRLQRVGLEDARMHHRWWCDVVAGCLVLPTSCYAHTMHDLCVTTKEKLYTSWRSTAALTKLPMLTGTLRPMVDDMCALSR